MLCQDRFLAGREKSRLGLKNRDRIPDNTKLDSQLKIVKKSSDNATKAPKNEISVPIFFSFLTFAGTFSHIIHRFKDFRPFHSLRTQSLSGNHRTGQENWDGTRWDWCLDTTLFLGRICELVKKLHAYV